MPNKTLRNVRIGWDIGGAHIKYCVESSVSNIIWYDFIDFEFWDKYNGFRDLIKKINSIYNNKNIKIQNYFTMSAEMCDCFDNRDIGVQYIIREILYSGCDSYVFTRNGFVKPDKINMKEYKKIASHNWYASAVYISKLYKNTIAVDFGSTTCDFIIIKNGKIVNKRTSDFTGLKTRELLYTGCSRTPIYAHLNEVTYNKRKFKIIPENFSSMSDIYIILDKIKAKDIYSKVIDGTDNTKKNAYKRVGRSFGFDFTQKQSRLVNTLSREIYRNQINLIENEIKHHKRIHFNDVPEMKIIALGLGQKIISEICKKNKLKSIDIKKILEYEINPSSSLSKLFPSYVMCRLSR